METQEDILSPAIPAELLSMCQFKDFNVVIKVFCLVVTWYGGDLSIFH